MIETIVRHTVEVLPRYGGTLWALLTNPVAEVSARSRSGHAVWDAVLFWAVSLALFLITRFLAFGSEANPTLFFVASGLSGLVDLLLVAAGFALVWRIFGAGYGYGSFLIATACIQGVVLPFQAVFGLVAIGAQRALDEGLYRLAVNMLSGCGEMPTPAALRETVAALPTGPGALWSVGLVIALTAVPLSVFAVYLLAYLRVLADLARPAAEAHRFGAVRLGAMMVLGCVAGLAAAGIAAAFDWFLFTDARLCL